MSLSRAVVEPGRSVGGHHLSRHFFKGSDTKYRWRGLREGIAVSLYRLSYPGALSVQLSHKYKAIKT
jgi:hypothetical protein